MTAPVHAAPLQPQSERHNGDGIMS